MSEERINLTRQLDGIKAFMESPAYKSFLFTLNTDVKSTEDMILHAAPVDLPGIINHLSLFARRDTLREQTDFFKDSRESLESRIAEIDNAEALAAEKAKQNQNENQPEL